MNPYVFFCSQNLQLISLCCEKRICFQVVVRVKIYNFSDSPAFFQSRVTSVNGGFSVYIRKNTDDGLQDGLESIHISKSKRKAEYLHLTCDGYKAPQFLCILKNWFDILIYLVSFEHVSLKGGF